MLLFPLQSPHCFAAFTQLLLHFLAQTKCPLCRLKSFQSIHRPFLLSRVTKALETRLKLTNKKTTFCDNHNSICLAKIGTGTFCNNYMFKCRRVNVVQTLKWSCKQWILDWVHIFATLSLTNFYELFLKEGGNLS